MNEFVNSIPKEGKGYVIPAMQDFEYDQATALAYSIKTNNKDAKVAIVTNYTDRIPHHYHEAFDHMITLPFGSSETTRCNDWQIYWATPFVDTIVIDPASLVKENHDSIWDFLTDQYDVCFFNKAYNFKGEQLANKKMQIFKEDYDMDLVYGNMYYFKHGTDLALAYHKLADPFMQNWRDVFAKYFKEQHRPKYYNNDVMHSILNTAILFEDKNIHNDIINIVNMPTTLSDGNIGMWNKWTDRLNTWTSKGAKVKIQNFAMHTNLYYGEQEFLTEEIFDGHRQAFTSTAKRGN